VWEKIERTEAGTWTLSRWDDGGWKRKEWDRWKMGLVESQVKLRNLETKELIAAALAAMEKCEQDGRS
jgi:hypothetical protein